MGRGVLHHDFPSKLGILAGVSGQEMVFLLLSFKRDWALPCFS
jgi:hypothetical protein